MKRLALSDEEVELIRRHREERVHYVNGWNKAIDAAADLADPSNTSITTHQLYDEILKLKMDL